MRLLHDGRGRIRDKRTATRQNARESCLRGSGCWRWPRSGCWRLPPRRRTAQPRRPHPPRSRPRSRSSAPRSRANGSTARRTRRTGWLLPGLPGQSPCLLGRTWGYDDQGVWVSDGCAGEFVVGRGLEEATEKPEAKEKAPAYIPNVGFLLVEGREGRDVRPALQLRALPEPEGAGPELHRLLRQHQHGEAARGRPAQQVLPALLRLVPDPEVPLLPLRLVVEHLAGRSRAGGGRREPELHVQPVRDPGRRHHAPSHRAQHRGPVPLLARRRRPADRGRVLPRLVHHRLLAQGRARPPSSSTWP